MLYARVRLYKVSEVPANFREPFILSGYRGVCNGSMLHSLRSTFLAPSNETFNVLTHLAAALWFSLAAGVWWQANWNGSVQFHLEINIYLVAVCVYPWVSAVAHVFSCASNCCRHLCFFMDYAALSFYALSAAIAYRVYAFPPNLLGGWCAQFYLPMAAVIAVLSLIGSCWSRFIVHGITRKCIRFLSFATPCFFDILPTMYGVVCDEEAFGPDFAAMFWRMIILTVLAAITYCLHIPERVFPGRFDFIGHSHQLFHILSALGSRDQMNAFLSRLDAKQRVASFPLPSTVISILAFVLVTDFIMVVFFTFHFCQFTPLLDDKKLSSASGNNYPCVTETSYANGNGHDKSH